MSHFFFPKVQNLLFPNYLHSWRGEQHCRWVQHRWQYYNYYQYLHRGDVTRSLTFCLWLQCPVCPGKGPLYCSLVHLPTAGHHSLVHWHTLWPAFGPFGCQEHAVWPPIGPFGRSVWPEVDTAEEEQPTCPWYSSLHCHKTELSVWKIGTKLLMDQFVMIIGLHWSKTKEIIRTDTLVCIIVTAGEPDSHHYVNCWLIGYKG